jgi:CheY-like chemotaxis protein
MTHYLNRSMAKNRILWADDDYDDLQMMREILGEKNDDFEIVEVHNGKEALEYLKQERKNLPCLIILDINMPVLDGKETLSILKRTQEYKDIPIVVFTTSASELDKLYCKRYNTEMVTKPPTFTTLGTALDKLLKFCR